MQDVSTEQIAADIVLNEGLDLNPTEYSDLLDTIESVQKSLPHLSQGERWVRVEDGLPEFDTPVWIRHEDGSELARATLGHGGTTWWWRSMSFSRITHWRPLPAPPSEPSREQIIAPARPHPEQGGPEQAALELHRAANAFGARVKEREPDWFHEVAGSTDFAEARDRLAKALLNYAPFAAKTANAQPSESPAGEKESK